ncbi:MAG: crossover junction endodeoxyribonuclease RuvC [Gammaproteobacteria bacterium]|nr:crossover junction endodeoxyribonuclease RuvC [Gammaproteobacteria bacterium]
MSRILGIDPGSRKTGYGLIESATGPAVGSPGFVACGVVKATEGEMPERLRVIFEGVTEILESYRPDVVTIESVFVNRNVSSALKLGQARGAVIVAVARAGVPMVEYSPRQIKQTVAGNGNADKGQVQEMIQRLLDLDACPSEDAADALAGAITHHYIGRTLSRLRDANG